jgi:hypothetical protein
MNRYLQAPFWSAVVAKSTVILAAPSAILEKGAWKTKNKEMQSLEKR